MHRVCVNLTCLVLATYAVPSRARAVEIAAGAGSHSLTRIPTLARILDAHATAERTTVSLKVVDVATGETLFDRGGKRLFVPASNLKIYTASCALDQFGPRYQFKTRLQARGELADGVLAGDIVLVGGGDAMLKHEQLAALAKRAAAEWQLREVRGTVQADNSRYSSPLKGPGWMWDDDPDYYNMSVTPLMVDFNVLTARLTADGEGDATLRFVPPSPAPPTRVVATTGFGEPAITRAPFTETITAQYAPPLSQAVEKELTMQDPGPWAAGMLRTMLADAGVTFTAPSPLPTESKATADMPIAAEIVHEGAPLIDALTHFLHASENAVGEVLLHEIAINEGVERPRWSDGAAAITRWLHQVAGLPEGSFRMVDGSGLSRYNLISADSSVQLLSFMHRHEHGEQFFDALPRYELQDATDADRDVVIAAKPGGMQSVSTISGYVRTRGGRLLAFSLLANGYIGSSAPIFDLRQKVWRALAEWSPSAVQ